MNGGTTTGLPPLVRRDSRADPSLCRPRTFARAPHLARRIGGSEGRRPSTGGLLVIVEIAVPDPIDLVPALRQVAELGDPLHADPLGCRSCSLVVRLHHSEHLDDAALVHGPPDEGRTCFGG